MKPIQIVLLSVAVAAGIAVVDAISQVVEGSGFAHAQTAEADVPVEIGVGEHEHGTYQEIHHHTPIQQRTPVGCHQSRDL